MLCRAEVDKVGGFCPAIQRCQLEETQVADEPPEDPSQAATRPLQDGGLLGRYVSLEKTINIYIDQESNQTNAIWATPFSSRRRKGLEQVVP